MIWVRNASCIQLSASKRAQELCRQPAGKLLHYRWSFALAASRHNVLAVQLVCLGMA